MKERYDRTHTHKHFNVGDRVYVTLHEGYPRYQDLRTKAISTENWPI
jgi:hypothetical protein